MQAVAKGKRGKENAGKENFIQTEAIQIFQIKLKRLNHRKNDFKDVSLKQDSY